jgi:RecA/RadA recombinase
MLLGAIKGTATAARVHVLRSGGPVRPTTQTLHAAFVDPADALDPRAAQALGVCLPKLLWVRLPRAADALSIGTRRSDARAAPP